MSKRVVSLLLTLLLTLFVCIPAFATAVEPADQTETTESEETTPAEEEQAAEDSGEEVPAEETSEPGEESSVEESTEAEAQKEESVAENPEKDGETDSQSNDDIMTVASANIVDSGYCGDPDVNEGKDVIWTLDNNGALTISGKGWMDNYVYLYSSGLQLDLSSSHIAPWYQYTGEIKSIIVKEGVRDIGRWAFHYCQCLENLSIAGSVESILEAAFSNCYSLVNVDIAGGVKYIHPVAFSDCKSLTSLTLPDSVESIFSGAFSYCASLTSVTIPDSVTNIGERAFLDCSLLTSVTIPNSVTTIGEYAFGYAESLYPDVQRYDPFTIYGYRGSEAERYAKDNDIEFVSIGGSSSEGVTIRAEKTTIEVGEDDVEVSLTVTGASLMDGDVTWTSSNPEVLTVSANVILNGIDHASATVKGISEGKATVTATTKDGKTASLEITVIAKPDEPPVQNIEKFTVQKDGWSFRNYHEGFEYRDDYFIPVERYNEVFGESYSATALASSDEVFASMMPVKWGGNCYGMAATSVLFNTKRLDWSVFSSKGKYPTVNSYRTDVRKALEIRSYAVSNANSEVTKLIERYQILKRASDEYEEDSTYDYLFDKTKSSYFFDELNENKENNYKVKHNPKGNYIKTLLEKINSSDKPLLITMTRANGEAHAVVARNDKEPELVNGWARVYIYDPNTPYMSQELIDEAGCEPKSYYFNHLKDDRYIELNPKLNQWRYKGSTIAFTSPDYWGSDAWGGVLSQDVKNKGGKTISSPDILYAYSLPSDYPTSFSGNEEWLVPEGAEYVSWISFSGDASFDVVSDSGEVICGVVDGMPYSNDNGIDYVLYDGVTYDDVSSSQGGKLRLPYDKFTVDYDGSGDISIGGTDSAINLKPEGHVVAKVNVDDTKVEVQGKSSGSLIVQLTDVYDSDTYSSVYADGILETGDEVAFQLTGDKFTADNGIKGESSLMLYTDNEDKPDSLYVETLDADNNGETVVNDVRELTSADSKPTPKPDYGIIPDVPWYQYQPEDEGEYVPGPDEVTYSGFPDVDPNAWYAGPVSWAAQSGVTAGYPDGNFHPDDTCTRAQIVTFLWKAAGTPMSVGTVSFSDVEQGSFYYDAAVWAANSGIIAGYPDGNFHPDDPCTRAQIVAMLYRYANSPAVSGESKFFDVDAGAYYYNAAIWAEQNGIVAGYPDGGFHPDDACTRAQIVTMLYNYIKG